MLTYSSILTYFAPKYSHKLYSYKDKSMAIIKKMVQQLNETIMSAIETTPLFCQFLSICFFIEQFLNAVLHCNLNWWRSCWAVQKLYMIGSIWFVHLRIFMKNLQVFKLPLLMSVMLNSVHCKPLILKKQKWQNRFFENLSVVENQCNRKKQSSKTWYKN